MLSLYKLFKNEKIKLLHDDFKKAIFNTFMYWLSNLENVSKNQSTLIKLFQELHLDIYPKDLSAFFYNVFIRKMNVENDQSEELLYLELLLFAIDSLFEKLPSSVQLPALVRAKASIYLPKLSINLNLNESVTAICKQNDQIIVEINTIKDRYVVKNKPDSLRVLNFDKKDYIYTNIISKYTQYEILLSEYFSQFSAKVREAINMILNIDPDFAELLNRVEFICPMAFIEDNITKSFTLSELINVLFLSDANSSLKIAENLIHETYHNELNLFMNFHNLHLAKEQLYYSPWRDDPRPIRGLIHAIYVFTGIYQYYSNILANPKKRVVDLDYINFRYNLIHYELELAYLQLHHNRSELTLLGQNFIDQLYDIYKTSISHHLYKNCPTSILNHVKKWQCKNKGYPIFIPENSEILEVGTNGNQ